MSEPAKGNAQFRVVVDYELSLQQMIDAGEYDAVYEFNPEAFAVTGSGRKTVDVILVEFDSPMTLHEVHAELKRQRLRPARIEHLLALGAQEGNLQRDFLHPILCTGSASVIDIPCPLPCLGTTSDNRERELCVILYGESWAIGGRFCALPCLSASMTDVRPGVR